MSIPSFPIRPEEILKSDSAGIAGASEVNNIVVISQAAYDALPVKSPTTLYVIS